MYQEINVKSTWKIDEEFGSGDNGGK